MSTRVDRGALRVAKAATVCAVDGCESYASCGRYCERCWSEMVALEKMCCAKEVQQLCRLLRRQERAENLRKTGHSLIKLLWIPELLFVAWALVYLAWKFGAMFLVWVVGQ